MRKYPWGTCEALSSEHSDFAALKKLLLETSFEELKEGTERRYYRFREEELLNLTDPDTGCACLGVAGTHSPPGVVSCNLRSARVRSISQSSAREEGAAQPDRHWHRVCRLEVRFEPVAQCQNTSGGLCAHGKSCLVTRASVAGWYGTGARIVSGLHVAQRKALNARFKALSADLCELELAQASYVLHCVAHYRKNLCCMRRRSFRPRFILNREPRKQDQPMLIKAGKVAAIIVGTYIAGALMLGGRDRLKVKLASTFCVV